MLENCKLSIITVCYNAEDTIEETMRSVLNQTFENLEYIIIDGASKDETHDIIKRVASYYPNRKVRITSEPDQGLYDAMNKGIITAQGEWVGIMNSGDVYPSINSLSLFFSRLEDSIDVDVLYGNAIEVSSKKEWKWYGDPDYTKLALYPIYRHGASFVKTSVHKEFLFDLTKKEFEHALDYDVIYRMYRAGKSFKYINSDLLRYEKEGISDHPWKSIFLVYKITTQDGHFFRPLMRLLRSMFVNLLKLSI